QEWHNDHNSYRIEVAVPYKINNEPRMKHGSNTDREGRRTQSHMSKGVRESSRHGKKPNVRRTDQHESDKYRFFRFVSSGVICGQFSILTIDALCNDIKG